MSNIFCFAFQADITLSVAMTSVSSLAACIFLPLNLYLYITATNLAKDIPLDLMGIVISALIVVTGKRSAKRYKNNPGFG